MTYKTIELQLLQLEEVFSKSKTNIYSDKKKEIFFLELDAVFNAIKKSDYKKFDQNELYSHFEILNFIFESLEFLDNSTLNLIPFEIVSCLEKVLKEWIQDNNFIIATSLSNRNLEFYFKGENVEFFNLINQYLSKRYNLSISKRLIKIVLPKILARDYLSNVVLYHELGHFIDLELNISENLFYEKKGIKHPNSYNADDIKFLNHLREFFADIFAAQYVNDSSNQFLNYIAEKDPDSHSHPSTAKRIEIVSSFLNKKTVDEVDGFNLVLNAMGNENLKIRHDIISAESSNFNDFVPQTLETDTQLHSIFKLGWDFWNSSEMNFLKEVSNRQKYQIINNLIEKSISNYIVLENWAKAKSE